MEGKTTTPAADEVRSCPSVRAASLMNVPNNPDRLLVPVPTLVKLSYSFPALADHLPSITAPIAVNNAEVSLFSSLFPTIKFDCYLTIMPYVRSASEQAWKCLESYMPPSGPIVARDLGLLLAYLMFVFDIRRMTLPGLVEYEIEGYKVVHFDSGRLLPATLVIAALLSHDAFVGGVDYSNTNHIVIDHASAANVEIENVDE